MVGDAVLTAEPPGERRGRGRAKFAPDQANPASDVAVGACSFLLPLSLFAFSAAGLRAFSWSYAQAPFDRAETAWKQEA